MAILNDLIVQGNSRFVGDVVGTSSQFLKADGSLDEEYIENLKKAKDYKVREINAYDKSNNVNCFYIDDNPMWLSVAARQQIATQITANEAVGREDMTRWFDGHSFTFTLAMWKQMLIALEVYAGDAINVTESHKAEVMSLGKIEDVEAYDITKDYPDKLSFYSSK